MSVTSRLPAFALVVLAAALLVAGYGAAVGIGVLAGMLLGLGSILAFLAMRPHTSGGSSYSFDTLSRAPCQPDPDFIQRHHHDWMRVAGVDASALRRVIPLGTSVEAGGARIELVAVELREDGGIATVAAYTRPPIGQAGQFVAVSVTDDAGTEYAAAGQGSGGGNVGTSRYDIRFAPTPPSEAGAIRIRVDSFVAPFPAPATRLDGPWEFSIDLR